jgi:hypothetical protein
LEKALFNDGHEGMFGAGNYAGAAKGGTAAVSQEVGGPLGGPHEFFLFERNISKGRPVLGMKSDENRRGGCPRAATPGDAVRVRRPNRKRATLDKEKRRADLLAKAKDAEEQAAKAKEPSVRNAWLRIAENYRVLAQHA